MEKELSLNQFTRISNSELNKVTGGTFIGYGIGYIISKGGRAWGTMQRNNPGMSHSAVYG